MLQSTNTKIKIGLLWALQSVNPHKSCFQEATTRSRPLKARHVLCQRNRCLPLLPAALARQPRALQATTLLHLRLPHLPHHQPAHHRYKHRSMEVRRKRIINNLYLRWNPARPQAIVNHRSLLSSALAIFHRNMDKCTRNLMFRCKHSCTPRHTRSGRTTLP